MQFSTQTIQEPVPMRAWILTAGLAATLVLAPFGRAEAGLAADWQEEAKGFMKAAGLSDAEQQRDLAILHVALFDAANAIEGKYTPYAYDGAALPDGNPQVAAIAAAATVLTALIPDQAEAIAGAEEAHMTSFRGANVDASVTLGKEAAKAVLDRRIDDGADFDTSFEAAAPGAGVYQKTSDEAMKSPRIGQMKPFVLSSKDQFLVPPPPAVDSLQHRRDGAEVARIGGAKTQTDPQSLAVAHRHNVSGSGSWNGIVREVLHDCNPGLVEEARTLALLNLALTDALIVGFDAKYTYGFWRPETAIKAVGSLHENPDVIQDAEWTPVLPTPMHPEYPCQHCTSGSAAQASLGAVFGAAPLSFSYADDAGVTEYTSFRQFAEEQSESRLLGGVHFRTSNIVGNTVGFQIGTYVGRTALQPVSGAAQPLSCPAARSAQVRE